MGCSPVAGQEILSNGGFLIPHPAVIDTKQTFPLTGDHFRWVTEAAVQNWPKLLSLTAESDRNLSLPPILLTYQRLPPCNALDLNSRPRTVHTAENPCGRIKKLEEECVEMPNQVVKGHTWERQQARSPSMLARLLVVLLAPAGCTGLEHGHDHASTTGLNPALFMGGAMLASSIEDCTLSDGTRTTCHSITIAGYPVNHDVGPFCPPTTSAGAEEGGIWFDGKAVYDVDGAFILSLATLYDDDHWMLYDKDGNVRITNTRDAFEAAARPDVDPEYQNHCVEGRMEWLENSEPVRSTVLIPTTPIVAGRVGRAHGNHGITLNGVIIAASAPVDAILGAYTIAAFDDCGGHINPFEGYHLHGARGCSEVGATEQGETPIFAYAMDGFAIHSSLEGGSAAEGLDECHGHTTDALGYHYHAANVEENGVLSCFTGLTVRAPGSEGRPAGGPPPPGGVPPNGGR